MATKTLKVVVVNSGMAVECNCPVGEGGTLEILQALVGGLIEYLPCGLDGIDPWINEEGSLTPNPVQQEKFSGEGFHVCGAIVYAGNDGAGETISLTPDQVKKILAVYRNNP